jgi:hypothetical protein
MAETDPFGREKSEDPLAEMGWDSSAAATPSAGPADIAPPERPDRAAARVQMPGASSSAPPRSSYRPKRDIPASGGIPGQGSRNVGGCFLAFIVIVFIGAIALALLPAIVDEIQKAGDEAERAEPFRPDRDRPGSDRPARDRSAGPPRGLASSSLFRRGNLAPVLRKLQRETRGSRIQLVRLDAEDLLITAVAGGKARFASATWEGDTNVLGPSDATGTLTTFSWSKLDPSAPNRIVRAATRGRRSSSFDYLVLTDPPGPTPLGWSGFLRGGNGIVNASPDGRRVRKVGG